MKPIIGIKRGKPVTRLPRKLKKRLFGKRGRRRHLAKALLDHPDTIQSIVNLFRL